MMIIMTMVIVNMVMITLMMLLMIMRGLARMDEKAGLPNWALTCLTVHPTPYTESTVEDDYKLQITNDCKSQIKIK